VDHRHGQRDDPDGQQDEPGDRRPLRSALLHSPFVLP
jgi:hypothetical protein